MALFWLIGPLPTPNVIGLLLPRAAFILLMEALEAHVLRLAMPALILKFVYA